MPAAKFTQPADIEQGLAVYAALKNLRAAAEKLSCSTTALKRFLRRHGVDTSNRPPQKLAHLTLPQLKEHCSKHNMLEGAAVALGVHTTTLRRRLKELGVSDFCSVLKPTRRPRQRPMTDSIAAVLREHGPMLDTLISEELARKGLTKSSRGVSQMIYLERQKTGTQVFRIDSYARKEGRAPGYESCVWGIGPEPDAPRPKQKSFDQRRRISRAKYKNKMGMIRLAKARKTAPSPFEHLIRRSRMAKPHALAQSSHETYSNRKAPSAFDHSYQRREA